MYIIVHVGFFLPSVLAHAHAQVIHTCVMQGIFPRGDKLEKMADSSAAADHNSQQQPLQAPVPKPRPRRARGAWTTAAVAAAQSETSGAPYERQRGASESGTCVGAWLRKCYFCIYLEEKIVVLQAVRGTWCTLSYTHDVPSFLGYDFSFFPLSILHCYVLRSLGMHPLSLSRSISNSQKSRSLQ